MRHATQRGDWTECRGPSPSPPPVSPLRQSCLPVQVTAAWSLYDCISGRVGMQSLVPLRVNCDETSVKLMPGGERGLIVDHASARDAELVPAQGPRRGTLTP